MTGGRSIPVWPQRPGLLALSGLLALVALAYYPGLRGGFVFDDYPNIVNASALHVTWTSSGLEWLSAAFSSPASDLQRPLAALTFAINHALTGLNPYWMKLTNLGIHLLNTGLVFGLCRLVIRAAAVSNLSATKDKVGRHEWIALWVAAAWALNPINLMAVLLVVQRMESLSHTFVFSGLWMYLVARMRLQAGSRGGWTLLFAGIVGGTLLGVLVKESAVLLPLYAFALEWALLGFAAQGRARDGRLIAVFCGVLLLPALIGLAWMIPKVLNPGAYATRSFDLGERLLTEGRVLIDYLHWTLVPNLSELSLYHDNYPVSRGLLDPPATLLSWVVLVALIAIALRVKKGHPLVALGLVWFLSAHLLTATIWPLELVYEHRNYFASLGLCLTLAGLLLWSPSTKTHKRIGIAAALALLTMYTSTTALRAIEWSNPLRFALTEVAKNPNSPRATYDLARDYILLSEFDRTSPFVDQAMTALEHAMDAPGATALPEAAAITLAARTGREIDPSWWRSMRYKLRANAVRVEGINALDTLAKCLPENGCNLPVQHVVLTFRAALERERRPETLTIFGSYALHGLRDPALALNLWQEAAQRAPNVAQYQENLARMFIASGRPQLAAAPIAKLRSLGKMGQNEAVARELEALAQQGPRGVAPVSEFDPSD